MGKDNLFCKSVIKRATFLASKLFSVSVQPWGEGQSTVFECVLKKATFLASKLFSVTFQPWGERIPVGKDKIMFARMCRKENHILGL